MNEYPDFTKEGYWYLAGPYSDNIPVRYMEHMTAAAILMKSGVVVYSPIVHCHEVAKRFVMPTDADFWESYNATMMRHSIGVILLKLSGWENSNGVKKELNFCFDHDLIAWGLEPPESLPGGGTKFKWNREM